MYWRLILPAKMRWTHSRPSFACLALGLALPLEWPEHISASGGRLFLALYWLQRRMFINDLAHKPRKLSFFHKIRGLFWCKRADNRMRIGRVSWKAWKFGEIFTISVFWYKLLKHRPYLAVAGALNHMWRIAFCHRKKKGKLNQCPRNCFYTGPNMYLELHLD